VQLSLDIDCALEQNGCVALLFDPNLRSVGGSLHQGAVRVLAEEAPIRKLDRHYFVLADHHARASDWVGLVGAGNTLDVPRYSGLLGSAVSLVVSDDPGHIFLAKDCLDSAGEQNFCISVAKVPHYHTIRGEDEQTVLLFVLCSQELILGKLDDITV